MRLCISACVSVCVCARVCVFVDPLPVTVCMTRQACQGMSPDL